jgi:hypothetical protein
MFIVTFASDAGIVFETVALAAFVDTLLELAAEGESVTVEPIG